MASDADTPLPGRVAAQLFVLGRTAEHAELVIRLIRTVLTRLDQPLGLGVDGGAESLQVLLSALGAVSGFDPVSEPEDRVSGSVGPAGRRAGGPAGRPGRHVGRGCADATRRPAAGRRRCTEPDLPTDRRALALVLDAGVDGSLVSSLGLLVDAAYSVREQLSSDTWQLVGDVEEEVARLRNRPPTQLVGVQSSLQRLLQALLALSGLSAENMERDPAWLFLDAGRRLERAQSLVRLVRAVLVNRRAAVVEDLLVESLLKTSDSLITFRRRSGSIMQVAGAVDLVVYDAANPRSVIYQLDRLFHHLSDLPSRSPGQRLGDEQRLVLEATTMLRLTDAARLAAVDADADRRPELDTVLSRVDSLLADLLDSLRQTFFVHERLSVTGRLSGRCRREIPVMYRIVHRTNYRYNAPVSRCRNEAHLRPRDTARQHCLASDLMVEPTPTSWSERTDFFGNPVSSFVVDGPFDELTVTSTSVGVGVGCDAAARHRIRMGAGPRLAVDRSECRNAVRSANSASNRPWSPSRTTSTPMPSPRSRRVGPWSRPSPSSPTGSSRTSSTTPGSPR